MSDLMQIVVSGNLGRDPEMAYTKNGKAYTKFTLASSEGWKNKKTGQWENRTTWFDVIVWGPYAEFLNDQPQLRKGAKVTVSGRPKCSAWIKRDGESADCKIEINATNVVIPNKSSCDDDYDDDEGDEEEEIDEAAPWDV